MRGKAPSLLFARSVHEHLERPGCLPHFYSALRHLALVDTCPLGAVRADGKLNARLATRPRSSGAISGVFGAVCGYEGGPEMSTEGFINVKLVGKG